MLDRLARRILEETFAACSRSGALALDEVPSVPVEPSDREEHGDFASGVCLTLARPLGRSPRDIAQTIVDHVVDPDGLLESIEVAGPGFLHLRFRREAWFDALHAVQAEGSTYGRSTVGAGRQALVEFVSANPTGPLHVEHGRGAVVGDVIANLLEAVGFSVSREYYLNDVGRQMWHLGASLYHRYRELLGHDEPYPTTCYEGDYVRDAARAFRAEHGDGLADVDYAGDEESAALFQTFVRERMEDDIRSDLERFGIRFDRWYRESSLYADDAVFRLLDALTVSGHIYTDEVSGARKFRTTAFGGAEDHVVVRPGGEPTYFAADLAYHRDKFGRGFDTLIDIWGADHHGYVPRVKAGLAAMGHPPEALEVVLVQFVHLFRGARPVTASPRAGVFVDLRLVDDAIGPDAARLFFVMRRADSQLDLDLDLARSATLDNPVYALQAGRKRIAAILGEAAAAGHPVPPYRPALARALRHPEELALARHVLAWPSLVESCALAREPHPILFYLQDLIGSFRAYDARHRTADTTARDIAAKEKTTTPASPAEAPDKRDGRLFLVDCVRVVLESALTLLGVSRPDHMVASPGGDEAE